MPAEAGQSQARAAGKITQKTLLENPVASFFDDAKSVSRIRRVLRLGANHTGFADKLFASRKQVYVNEGIDFQFCDAAAEKSAGTHIVRGGALLEGFSIEISSLEL